MGSRSSKSAIPAYPSSRASGDIREYYSSTADCYCSLDEVTAELLQAGLESSNLIVGIDFTKSNEWTGAKSFNGRCLHHIGNDLNPYEQAISIIGKTLSAFDDDNLIPCFGFGDALTNDEDVFSFFDDKRSCQGFEEVLSRYRELVPQVKLAGPTSFAPLIEMAMTIVEQSGGQYHVLLIVADGQVTRSIDTAAGQLSPQEQKTIDALVQASKYPLSIILVGVGDGPWYTMKEFDDNIPARAFDNFHFVNFTEIMSKTIDTSKKEIEFALAALMEIPAQYNATIDLGLLCCECGHCPERVALPPTLIFGSPVHPEPTTGGNPTLTSTHNNRELSPSPLSNDIPDNQLCPICLSNAKDMAFGCGHQTCCDCGESLDNCPICRRAIQIRIKLY